VGTTRQSHAKKPIDFTIGIRYVMSRPGAFTLDLLRIETAGVNSIAN